MDQLRKYSEKIEGIIERLASPLKPHVAAIGRFLLVVTFLEDSLRIIMQFPDQLWYLEKHRGFPYGFSHIFLIANVITMLVCSYLAVARKYTEQAVAGLFVVVVSQTIGYGLISNANFFLRTLSVIGGLLMLLSESLISSKRKSLFPGLPELSESKKTMYLSLTGRVLLAFLFFSFVFAGEFSVLRLIFCAIGSVACLMVVVGFKAKWSALFLIMFLSVFNVIINNWWSLHHTHPMRDFMKYDFFQTLSIVGGLLLLFNIGPGGMSVDEKKKAY